LTGALVKGVQGAMEEQQQIARLGAALKANVPAWDGDMSAITGAVKARENLGFADDALRASLITLLPATHNIGKALAVQSTAMDLARLKGISLEDASAALTKVEGGQYRMLKSLGIVLKDGATHTEALAAVQQVAMGQAATYAGTLAGKTEILQAKIQDLTEEVGGALIPALDGAATSLLAFIDAIDPESVLTLDQRIGGLAGTVSRWTPFMAVANTLASKQDDLIVALGGHLPDTRTGFQKYGDVLGDLLNPTRDITKAQQHFAGALDGVAQSGADALAAVQKEVKYLQEHQDAINEINHLIYGTTVPGYVHTKPKAKPHAAGGWVGLNGPELGVLGEKGPEYITPNKDLRKSSGSGVTIQGVSEREIMDMVDRGLYFRLRRAGTGA